MAIKPEILKTWGPGGWSFYQPETDWHAPGPLENTFEKQVQNIIAMRKANPRFNLPTDEPTVAADLEAFTEARWAAVYSKKGMEKFRAGPPPSAESKKKESHFTQPPKSPLGVVVGLAGIDTASLEDWLGAGGKPVALDLAESRAGVCVSCPANKGNWRELLTIPAAMTVKKYLELKNQMKLETSQDANLESCDACHCVLTLKVWQPPEHIKNNSTPDVLDKHAKANPNCWVLTER